MSPDDEFKDQVEYHPHMLPLTDLLHMQPYVLIPIYSLTDNLASRTNKNSHYIPSLSSPNSTQQLSPL